ncbi:MAG: ATP-binding protein [Eubacterium sp.]|nr:ATP-binding protein [Eubacterium sp.]
MSYPKEIYLKAERILEKRRDSATMDAEIRADEIRNAIPEIDEIQNKLSRIGLELSQIFFYNGDAKEKVAELREKSKALTDERAKILAKNGYKPNSMSPEFICPVCEDKGFVGGRICNCHRQLLKDLMKEELRKVAPLDDCTFDNFDTEKYSDQPDENGIIPRDRVTKIFDAARKYAQNFSLSSKNLLFIGATGLGKTHLSLAIANVAVNRGFYVCYGTSQNICEDLQSEQFGRDSDIFYTKRQVLDCDLLVIDDLGTEIDSQYSIATLYNIINSRILAKRPTIISTNYEPSELFKKYDQRITSRITGEYTAMQFLGADIRNE